MSFLINLILLPIKILLLPLYLVAGVFVLVAKLVVGVSVGVVSLIFGAMGLILFFLFLPGAFVALSLGGGVLLLLGIGLVVALVKLVPQVASALYEGLSGFFGKWA